MMIKPIIAIVAMALGGCAAFISPAPDSIYEWYHSGREPLPMKIEKTSQDNVQALCCNTDGFVMACAWRDYQKKTCTVYTALGKLPSELTQHEWRHCQGEEHQVINPISNPKQCKNLEQLEILK